MAKSESTFVTQYLIDAESEFHVSEFATNSPGAMSPFGDDIALPLPVSKVSYRHPRPENRPNLAGGR